MKEIYTSLKDAQEELLLHFESTFTREIVDKIIREERLI
jgi:hypothetical protein